MARFSLPLLLVLVVLLQLTHAAAISRRRPFLIRTASKQAWAKVPIYFNRFKAPVLVDSEKAGLMELWRFTPVDETGHLRITNVGTRLTVAAYEEPGSPVFAITKDQASPWRVETVLGSKSLSIIRLANSNLVWTWKSGHIALTPYVEEPEQQWDIHQLDPTDEWL